MDKFKFKVKTAQYRIANFRATKIVRKPTPKPRFKLDIVNHSYNYSRCLSYQLSSLILFATEINVDYYIYFSSEDKDTLSVLDYFEPLLPSNIRMIRRDMKLGLLRNRAWGRNEVAKNTSANWIWFTDTDYLFGEDCLNNLHNILEELSNVELVFPKIVKATDHPSGDYLISRMVSLGILDVDRSLFKEHVMSRAIGGIQIALGSYCNKVGYTNPKFEECSKWAFRSDVVFRRSCSKYQSIMLSNVFRIRHGVRGYKDVNVHL